MSLYQRIPAEDTDEGQYELEAPAIHNAPPVAHTTSDKGSNGSGITPQALWWISLILLSNVGILLLNLYLTAGTTSTIAMFKEKPLSELRRPDPLYGVKRKGDSGMEHAT